MITPMMPVTALNVESAQPYLAVERTVARVSKGSSPANPRHRVEVTMMPRTVLVVSDRAKRPERNCQYHIKPCAPDYGGVAIP